MGSSIIWSSDSPDDADAGCACVAGSGVEVAGGGVGSGVAVGSSLVHENASREAQIAIAETIGTATEYERRQGDASWSIRINLYRVLGWSG